jgi:hypothetical protein
MCRLSFSAGQHLCCHFAGECQSNLAMPLSTTRSARSKRLLQHRYIREFCRTATTTGWQPWRPRLSLTCLLIYGTTRTSIQASKFQAELHSRASAALAELSRSGYLNHRRRRILHILRASKVWAWRNGDQYAAVRGGTLRPV